MLETGAVSWVELGLLSSLFPLHPLHFLFFSHFFCSTEWPWLTITNHPPCCPPPLPLPASEITQGPLSLFLSCSLASFLLGSLQSEVTFPSLQAHRLKACLLFSFNKLLSFLSFSLIQCQCFWNIKTKANQDQCSSTLVAVSLLTLYLIYRGGGGGGGPSLPPKQKHLITEVTLLIQLSRLEHYTACFNDVREHKKLPGHRFLFSFEILKPFLTCFANFLNLGNHYI